MCGICGVIGVQGVSEDTHGVVRAMSNLIAHRGPDGEGFWDTPHGTLGHRRLAIIDVEGGTRIDCMRILRHEAGHVVQNAFKLQRRRRWQELHPDAEMAQLGAQAYQEETSKPETLASPDSAIVGTCGAPATRLAEVIATAFRRPSLMNGPAVASAVTSSGTCPATTSVTAWPPPL